MCGECWDTEHACMPSLESFPLSDRRRLCDHRAVERRLSSPSCCHCFWAWSGLTCITDLLLPLSLFTVICQSEREPWRLMDWVDFFSHDVVLQTGVSVGVNSLCENHFLFKSVPEAQDMSKQINNCGGLLCWSNRVLCDSSNSTERVCCSLGKAGLFLSVFVGQRSVTFKSVEERWLCVSLWTRAAGVRLFGVWQKWNKCHCCVHTWVWRGASSSILPSLSHFSVSSSFSDKLFGKRLLQAGRHIMSHKSWMKTVPTENCDVLLTFAG